MAAQLRAGFTVPEASHRSELDRGQHDTAVEMVELNLPCSTWTGRLNHGQRPILPYELDDRVVACISGSKSRSADVLRSRVVVARRLDIGALVQVTKIYRRRSVVSLRRRPGRKVLDLECLRIHTTIDGKELCEGLGNRVGW